MTRRILFLLAVTLLHTRAGAAQAGMPAATGSRYLTPSRTVRVQAERLGRLQGQVVSITGTDVVLRTGDGTEQPVPFASINTAWVRKRHTWLGAAIGGAVGVAGGVFFAELAKGLCEYDCTHGIGVDILGGLLVGAGGAVVGGIVGSAFPRWVRVFPSDR